MRKRERINSEMNSSTISSAVALSVIPNSS